MKQAGTIFFFFLLILFPKISVEGARQGLILWGLTLVPTLLPFFIVTKSILQWKIPGNLLLPYLFFVGYFCGYPTGAVIVNQLYLSGALTKKQSNLFICFCNHASPAFLFNFGILGFLLYFGPFLAIFVYGLYFGIRKIKNIDSEYIMYVLGIGLAFAISVFSGYVFFNMSVSTVIAVICALLINKIWSIKKDVEKAKE